jgi:hypothetical protein
MCDCMLVSSRFPTIQAAHVCLCSISITDSQQEPYVYLGVYLEGRQELHTCLSLRLLLRVNRANTTASPAQLLSTCVPPCCVCLMCR